MTIFFKKIFPYFLMSLLVCKAYAFAPSQDNWLNISENLPRSTEKPFNSPLPNSLTAYKSKLYAVRNNTFYQFNGDLENPLWTSMAEGTKNSKKVYALLAFNDRLYVGGENFSAYTEAKGWTSLSKKGLKNPIIKMVALDGKIIALTRNYDIESEGNVFSYDVQKDAWTPLKLKLPHSGSVIEDMIAFKNKLYVSGENKFYEDMINHSDNVPVLYVYDPASPKKGWKDIASGLPKGSFKTSADIHNFTVLNDKLLVGASYYTTVHDKIEQPYFVYTYNGNELAPQWLKTSTVALPKGFVSDLFFRISAIKGTLYAAGTGYEEGSYRTYGYLIALDNKNPDLWTMVGKNLPYDTMANADSLLEFNNDLYLSITYTGFDDPEPIFALAIPG